MGTFPGSSWWKILIVFVGAAGATTSFLLCAAMSLLTCVWPIVVAYTVMAYIVVTLFCSSSLLNCKQSVIAHDSFQCSHGLWPIWVWPM